MIPTSKQKIENALSGDPRLPTKQRIAAWLNEPVGRRKAPRWEHLVGLIAFLAFLAVFSYVAEVYG